MAFILYWYKAAQEQTYETGQRMLTWLRVLFIPLTLEEGDVFYGPMNLERDPSGELFNGRSMLFMPEHLSTWGQRHTHLAYV